MPGRTNAQWIADLKSEGEQHAAALTDLRRIILTGLSYSLSKWLSNQDTRFAPLAEEVAQDTLLRVLDRLDTFQGHSQFTTWVHKIAVRIALTELRRKRWNNVSLDDLVESEENPTLKNLMMDRDSVAPEAIVEGGDVMQLVRRIIVEELTVKQRKAMIAIAIKGMPLEEAARQMGTNRNALYKLMYDSRQRLKHRLLQEGLTPDEIFGVFESR